MVYNAVDTISSAQAILLNEGIEWHSWQEPRKNCFEFYTQDNVRVAIYTEHTGRLWILNTHQKNYEFTKKYKQGISIKQIEASNPCAEQFNKFATLAMKDGYTYTELLPLTALSRYASQCENGHQWLVENGFIQFIEKYYHIGQYFKDYKDDFYMLISTGSQTVCMFNLLTGNRLAKSRTVANISKITQDEFYNICAGCSNLYKPIKSLKFMELK